MTASAESSVSIPDDESRFSIRIVVGVGIGVLVGRGVLVGCGVFVDVGTAGSCVGAGISGSRDAQAKTVIAIKTKTRELLSLFILPLACVVESP